MCAPTYLHCPPLIAFCSSSVSTIGIWGRSMGAATALLCAFPHLRFQLLSSVKSHTAHLRSYCQMDPSIACIVLDSAFTSLKHIMHELAAQYTTP